MKNIIIFGEIGSGKSSIVNLIVGGTPAKVSDSAVGCTFRFQTYPTPNGYSLYDTVGLSEGKHGTMASGEAMKQLVNLLKSLKDGVSLLILVIKKDRIKESTEKNCRLFAHVIGKSKVPVILVITGCEMEPQVGTWWRDNKRHFDGYKMNFVDVIFGCAADPEGFIAPLRPHITQLRTETKAKVERSIHFYALREPLDELVEADYYGSLERHLFLVSDSGCYEPRNKRHSHEVWDV